MVQPYDRGEPIVTNELVEFEKHPVEVQDCRKITDHTRGIYKIYPNLIKDNRRLSTSNQLDLQTLGSQPLLPENLAITGSAFVLDPYTFLHDTISENVCISRYIPLDTYMVQTY